MTYYSITKTTRKNINVYLVRVRNKASGVTTFSKSITFQNKTAAVKRVKGMVHKIERPLIDVDIELVDCTVIPKCSGTDEQLTVRSLGHLNRILS